MARSNRLSGAFIWENARTYDSMDIVEDFGLKFNRCSHFKEYIRNRPPGFAVTKICSSGPCLRTKMTPVPLYGENVNLLLQNQQTNGPETWDVALETRLHWTKCSNDDSGLTFGLFTQVSVSELHGSLVYFRVSFLFASPF